MKHAANPFIQDGESTHRYNDRTFVVDFYYNGVMPGVWQCSDQGHIVRARAFTKEKAIEDAHKAWDNYLKKQPA